MMHCFFLMRAKVENCTKRYNNKSKYECTPYCSNHHYNSTNMRSWYHVCIPICSHGNNCSPNCLYELFEILLAYCSVINDLVYPNYVWNYQDRDSQYYWNCSFWSSLYHTFQSKSYIWWKSIIFVTKKENWCKIR